MDQIIINADDLGLSGSVNRAIVTLLQQDVINSATLMANMPGFEEAVQLVHEKNLVQQIGIHLVLTNGEPVGKMANTKDYFFNGKARLRDKFKRNPFHISAADRAFVYQEFAAQIEKLQARGIPISHLDSHHHVHEYFGITRILVQLARKYQVPAIRILNNLESGSSFPKRLYRNFVNRYLRKEGLQFSNQFGDRNDFLKWISGIQKLPAGEKIEIMVHPDFNEGGQIIDRVGKKEYDFAFAAELMRRPT